MMDTLKLAWALLALQAAPIGMAFVAGVVITTIYLRWKWRAR